MILFYTNTKIYNLLWLQNYNAFTCKILWKQILQKLIVIMDNNHGENVKSISVLFPALSEVRAGRVHS